MPPGTPSTAADVAGITLEVDAVALARFSELVGINLEVETAAGRLPLSTAGGAGTLFSGGPGCGTGRR